VHLAEIAPDMVTSLRHGSSTPTTLVAASWNRATYDYELSTKIGAIHLEVTTH